MSDSESFLELRRRFRAGEHASARRWPGAGCSRGGQRCWPVAGRAAGPSAAAAAPAAPAARHGQGQGGHPDLDVGRAVAPRHLRPQAGGGLRLLRPARTSPSRPTCTGIRICELLPVLAKQADKYSLIRSMTHGNNGHETASYMVQTGRHGRRPAGLSLRRAPWSRCSRATMPAIKGLIPPYIVLTEPQGRFSEAGFLGVALQALRHRRRPRPEPRSPWKASSPPASPTSGSTTAATCSHKLNTLGNALPGRSAAGRLAARPRNRPTT